MPSSRIKYGQIGVGHAHASKIGVYRQSADYEVVGVFEPNADLRAQAEKTEAFGGLKWMALEQLLNEPGLEVVGIETRVKDLLPMAKEALRAGKHVHIDKPAGESLEEFREVLDLAARAHLAVQMGYMYRYSPAFVMLRDLLKKGWLGEPFEVHAVMSKQIGAADRLRLAEYPGGSMFELGCHLIDLVVGVLGKPEKTHAFPRHSSAIDDSLADNMLAVFEYPRATAAVRSSVNEVEGGARRHFVLCGSEGVMHIQPLDNPSAKLALSRDREGYRRGYQDISFPPYVRYVDDAADLARIVRREKEPDWSYAHDLAVQETLLAACGVVVDG
jgi:predicted dehydrogenase